MPHITSAAASIDAAADVVFQHSLHTSRITKRKQIYKTEYLKLFFGKLFYLNKDFTSLIFSILKIFLENFSQTIQLQREIFGIYKNDF